jgi:hypothetical protein
MSEKTVRALDLILYNARKKFFGVEHARDLTLELKGKDLLSRSSFKMAKKNGTSTNHEIVRRILHKCIECQVQHPIFLFGATVFGETSTITNVGKNRLSAPLADILNKVSDAATRLNEKSVVHLVFDGQMCGAEPHIAASVRRFVSGVQLRNVSHYPLIGVSHVTPGIQLADIVAFILGRCAHDDPDFISWFEALQPLEWTGSIAGFQRRGFQKWEKDESGKTVIRRE